MTSTGDLAHALQSGGHGVSPNNTPHVLAFSCKDYGADATVDLASTMRAMGHGESHANAGGQLAVAFDTTQITSPENRSNPQPGDPCHPLSASAHPPAIAFDARQECVSSTEVFGALGSSSPQAQAVSYAIQAGALRTNPASGPDGVGVQKDIAYTLEACAEVQAVAMTLDAAAGRSRGAGTPVGMLAAVCVTGDITHTLKAEGFDASEDGTGRGQPIVAARCFDARYDLAPHGVIGDREIAGALTATTYKEPPTIYGGMAVRRLTPRECERLQGFPDDYTLVPVKKAKRRSAQYDYTVIDGQLWQLAADGPRYKALGNSWAVPVVRWLGRRIDKALRATMLENAA